jgi:Holliday junction DNA helicase RuvA
MIAQLKGSVSSIGAGFVVLDVHGVGYKIYTSFVSREGSEIMLWTHLAVRETALDLYGFKHREELSLFELLVSVSGIGPKSALAILSMASVETLRSAIASGDTSYLTKVSGIGRKTAQKIVLELKEKVGDAGDVDLRGAADAVEVLRSLGYSQQESRDAIQQVDPEISSTGERVKSALKIIGGNHNDNG